MRIATWNVNSVRTREDRVLLWLREHEPDVLCMQETKVVDEDFPTAGFEELGYTVSIHGQKTYNGVAIASRLPVEDVVVGLPLDGDDEARGIAVTVGGVRIVDVYVPNGSEVGSDKYAYKLRWLDALGAWLDGNADPSAALVVTGDYNIAPDDRDVWDAEAWRGQVLCTDEERARFQSLLRWGLTDALRAVNDEASVYTQWDYRGAAFRFNQGVRIDHLLVSGPVLERLQSVELSRDDRKVRDGVAKPSDHIPVTLVLSD
ncbi:MAG: exodeoxyribonuclease III [Dehalococcoidia bacterium]|jgi:exodeoxyribonuclease III|nr:exodeoxyribonuclease III [Dehalococcoidia bacterium]